MNVATVENPRFTHGHPQFSTHGMPARAILERKIADGARSAQGLLEHLHTAVPRDVVAKHAAIGFAHDGTLKMSVADVYDPLTDFAFGQVAERIGVPRPYLRGLVDSKQPWQNDLALRILRDHFGHTGEERALVRTVNGVHKGVLSDRYRRLDCRPLFDALATEAQALGAVPVDGVVTDTRVVCKVVLPTVYEPIPGEALAFGFEWSNSDFGNGTHAIRGFILRLWCLNGATGESALREVHLGRRLAEDIELSDRTMRLDTQTSVSAMRDVVRGTLGPAKVEGTLAAIRAAHDQKIDWKNVSGRLAKVLNKGELEKAKDAFEGQDTYNLPAEKTMWRASNVVSWIAKAVDDADRKLDLERVAGELAKMTA